MKILYKLPIMMLLLLVSNSSWSQCNANFTDTASAFGSVTFSNTSTSVNVPSYYWFFGDGQTSSLANPTNVYAGNGVYTVTLTLNDTIALCSSTYTRNVTVSNAGCILNPGFTYYIGANGVVTFYDTSSGVFWPAYNNSIDFGDGSPPIYLSNFVPHTYTAGTYTVVLNVSNSPTCTSSYSTVITVSILPCPLNASFTYTVNNGTVNFSNTSTGSMSTTIYYWDYGNGTIQYMPNTQSPGPQTYANNGAYRVTLKMQDSLGLYCSDTTSQIITLTNAPCLVNSSFYMLKDTSVISSVVWNAYPSFPSNVTAVEWNWGDGSTSNAMYPSHTFSATGYYNICLSVTVACGSSTSTCMNSSIYRVNENMQIATVHVIPGAGPTGIATIDPAAATLLFPNPASNELNITNTPSEYNVMIVDMLGNTVYVKTHNGPAKIDLQAFKSGVYFIQLSGNGFHKNSKLVKD